jgi:hypothetical protein
MLRFSKFFLLIGLLAQLPVQAQFVDDFSDGDFTSNPTWSGEDTKFEVNGSNELHLNAPAVTEDAYLSTPSGAIENATWEFLVRMDFGPSSSNNSEIYLVSDQADVTGPVNGYFVRIGGESPVADAKITLQRADAGSGDVIISSLAGMAAQDSVNMRVKVTRDAIGNWELQADTLGGTAYESIGTVFDDTYFQSFYFGVRCEYTSTRADKFFFDDFNVTGDPFVDAVVPQFQSVSATSSTTLQLQFDEPMDGTTASVLTNYSVNPAAGNLTIAALNGGDNTKVDLIFDASFQIGIDYELTAQNVEDLAGNSIVNTSHQFVYFEVGSANYRDVSINEIFADPSPIVGLPGEEFIELHNRTTDQYINVQDWTLSDGSSTSTLDSVIIHPGDFYIITAAANIPAFIFYGNVMGVGSFPSLNNAGDLLELRDSTGALMDVVNYSDEWYQDEEKASGGYTLEQINPFANCSGSANWIGSNASPGGTPNIQNSVYDDTPDVDAPNILGIEVIAGDTILVDFNEPLDAGITLTDLSVSGGVTVAGFNLIQPDLTSMQIWFDALVDSGVTYTLTITDFSDCEGNATSTDQGDFILPFTGIVGELVINEILYNPRTGSDDYIELKNISDRVIDLQGWYLADFDDDTIGAIVPISWAHFALEPNGIIALTEDSMNVKMEYITHGIGRFLETDIPSMSNDSGTVFLISPTLEVAEQFSYNDDMHFALLDADGVSLERIATDRPVDDPTNWHSAAATIGFGTPGLENSQYYPTNVNAGTVTTDPEIFSPDYDGYNDVVNISYQFEEIGNLATITIYDPRGRVVKRLVENHLLNAEGTISWDGETEDGSKARIGMYLIHFEVFNANGKTADHKLSTIVGGRL